MGFLKEVHVPLILLNPHVGLMDWLVLPSGNAFLWIHIFSKSLWSCTFLAQYSLLLEV